MSTNIHFHASRAVMVLATEKLDRQTVAINVWQTPTSVTRKIIAADDPVEAYVEWVNEISVDEQEPVYAEDDFWHERDPIEFRTVNVGKEHAKEFLATVAAMKEEGYEIIAEAW